MGPKSRSGGVGIGYVRPVQFLDHLTVIITDWIFSLKSLGLWTWTRTHLPIVWDKIPNKYGFFLHLPLAEVYASKTFDETISRNYQWLLRFSFSSFMLKEFHLENNQGMSIYVQNMPGEVELDT